MPESSYGMAVPLFHDVQTVDGSGIRYMPQDLEERLNMQYMEADPEPGYG